MALEATASSIAIITLGLTTVRATHNVVSGIKNSPDLARRALAIITGLENIITELQEKHCRRDLPHIIHTTLTAATEELQAFHRRVDKFSYVAKINGSRRHRLIAGTDCYIHKQDLEEVLASISYYTQQISAHLIVHNDHQSNLILQGIRRLEQQATKDVRAMETRLQELEAAIHCNVTVSLATLEMVSAIALDLRTNKHYAERTVPAVRQDWHTTNMWQCIYSKTISTAFSVYARTPSLLPRVRMTFVSICSQIAAPKSSIFLSTRVTAKSDHLRWLPTRGSESEEDLEACIPTTHSTGMLITLVRSSHIYSRRVEIKTASNGETITTPDDFLGEIRRFYRSVYGSDGKLDHFEFSFCDSAEFAGYDPNLLQQSSHRQCTCRSNPADEHCHSFSSIPTSKRNPSRFGQRHIIMRNVKDCSMLSRRRTPRKTRPTRRRFEASNLVYLILATPIIYLLNTLEYLVLDPTVFVVFVLALLRTTWERHISWIKPTKLNGRHFDSARDRV